MLLMLIAVSNKLINTIISNTDITQIPKYFIDILLLNNSHILGIITPEKVLQVLTFLSTNFLHLLLGEVKVYACVDHSWCLSALFVQGLGSAIS